MFELYFTSFEENLIICRKLHNKNDRTEEETLKLLQLLRRNDENLQGMKLESLSNPTGKAKNKEKLIAQYEKEHAEMSRRITAPKKDRLFMQNDDFMLEEKNGEYVNHYQKMNQLNIAKKNVHDANTAANDALYVFARDKERFQNQIETIKLMNEELVLSRDMIRKIKKVDNKSKYIYYAAVATPVTLILAAFLIKLGRLLFSH